MKVLFHTHYYFPETGPATKRISGLAENLKNYEINFRMSEDYQD